MGHLVQQHLFQVPRGPQLWGQDVPAIRQTHVLLRNAGGSGVAPPRWRVGRLHWQCPSPSQRHPPNRSNKPADAAPTLSSGSDSLMRAPPAPPPTSSHVPPHEVMRLLDHSTAVGAAGSTRAARKPSLVWAAAPRNAAGGSLSSACQAARGGEEKWCRTGTLQCGAERAVQTQHMQRIALTV